MAYKSTYLETAFLNEALRATNYAAPTTVYAALYTAAPTDSGGGTEVSGNAYARQAVTFAAPSGSPSACTNSAAVTFPAATPSGWGTITHFGLLDAVTSGNLLYWGALTVSKTVNVGDVLQFNASAISISED